jgi:hypothetical protein
MPAHWVAVPATATAAVTRSRSASGIARASAGPASSLSARSSCGVGGSECRWRSEWRTTPTCVETWKPTSPRSPITSSVEPPPMSITSRRSPSAGVRAAVAPRKVSCASSSPLSVRLASPWRSRTAAANAPPLDASRTADVMTAAAAVASCSAIAAVYSSRTAWTR